MPKFPRVVYMITHNATKRMYIGSTSDLKMRLKIHFNNLRAGRCRIEDMQSDFDKYGEDYTVEILDEIKDINSLIEYEYMDLYKSRIRGIGYNYKDNHAIRKKRL